MQSPLIELKDIKAGYGSQPVIDSVNLKIYPSDFIGIIGPNGGGKTTLVKIILGLLKPFSGSVNYYFNNNGIHSMGYLPQLHQLDSHFPITVYELVLSGLQQKNQWTFQSTKKRREKVDMMLKKFGLEKIKNKLIGNLSGGQQQRAFLARAIISSPQLIVLDEPDTFVDNASEKELYEILKELNQQSTILLVSHDMGMISSYVKSIACMNGTLHYHPTNEINAEVLKSYNCPIDLITHGHLPHRVLGVH